MNLSNKKCVIFCPTDTWGGVEKNVMLRANYLQQQGVKVYIVILKDLLKEKFSTNPEIEVISVSSRGGDLNLMVVSNYVRILKEIKPDVVFSALKKDWFLVSLSAKLAGVPRCILYLGIYRKIRKGAKYKLVFDTLKSKILVNSYSLKDHLIKNGHYFNEKNTFMIHNGFVIPEDDLNPRNLRQELNLSNDTYIIGCAGRFSEQKGFDLLPKILEQLPENFHVVHIGSGPDEFETTLKAKIAQTPQAQRIHFLGYCSEPLAFYKGLNVFLLPSRWEGMANVLNEAMSVGTPVVSTLVSGSEELLENGKLGILAPINDTTALAKAILAMAEGEIQFDSKKLQDQIADKFSYQQMMNRTANLFFGDLDKV